MFYNIVGEPIFFFIFLSSWGFTIFYSNLGIKWNGKTVWGAILCSLKQNILPSYVYQPLILPINQLLSPNMKISGEAIALISFNWMENTYSHTFTNTQKLIDIYFSFSTIMPCKMFLFIHTYRQIFFSCFISICLNKLEKRLIFYRLLHLRSTLCNCVVLFITYRHFKS